MYLEVIKGVDGYCLTITDNPEEGSFRIAGAKPYGGGIVVHTFKVDLETLKEQIAMFERAK